MSHKRVDSTAFDFPDKKVVNEFRRKLISWGRKNYVAFPWRTTDNKFHALIAEVMLQRTRAEQVEPVYRRFEKKYPTISSAFNDQNNVRLLLIPLGLKWRAQKIVELIEELHRIYGMIPKDAEGLKKLPGVGVYVASIFLSCHRGVRAYIVDNNVVRLYGRILGFVTTENTRRKRNFLKLADLMTPKRSFKSFNYALLDHTRMLCKSKPLCFKCPVKELCNYSKLM